MRRLSTSLLMILLLAVPLVVSAQVYKWTDAHGTVHFSDAAPPHGVKYTIVKVAAGSGQPAAQGSQAAASNGDDASDNPASAGSSGGSTGPMADTPANRAKLCSNLTSNIALLKQNRPVILRGPDGKNQLLSKDRQTQQLDLAQKRYEVFCQGQGEGQGS